MAGGHDDHASAVEVSSVRRVCPGTQARLAMASGTQTLAVAGQVMEWVLLLQDPGCNGAGPAAAPARSEHHQGRCRDTTWCSVLAVADNQIKDALPGGQSIMKWLSSGSGIRRRSLRRRSASPLAHAWS